MTLAPLTLALIWQVASAQDRADLVDQPCLVADNADPPVGFVCVPTYDENDNPVVYLAVSEILNVQRGDLLLTPGCGLIGSLLRNVQPPQHYSHEGIMTDNGRTVVHTTAVDARYMDYLSLKVWPTETVGTDGFQAGPLKFGWPGAILQPVMDAFEGATIVDPLGHPYWKAAFGANAVQCSGDSAPSPPRVIKPSPDVDETVRADLFEVADAGEAMEGVGHYRWFNYSDGDFDVIAPAGAGAPDVEDGAALPPGADWAGGTRPVVSSVFVWKALKDAGIQLECAGPAGCDESDVAGEFPHDLERGYGVVDTQTKDGLYFYTEEERRDAAEWLHQSLVDRVAARMEKHPDYEAWHIENMTDAQDDTANQFTNCMAFDWCGSEGAPPACDEDEADAKDSECWRNPGVGRTASPEDFFLWDPPHLGYWENLVYSTGRFRHAYHWQPSSSSSTVRGRVLRAGMPVPLAGVTVETIPGVAGLTADDGTFSIVAVPWAKQAVQVCECIGPDPTIVGPEACLSSEADHFGAAVVIDNAGEDVHDVGTLALEPGCPDLVGITQLHREINVSGTLKIADHVVVGKDNVKSFDLSSIVTDVPPGTDPMTVMLTWLEGSQHPRKLDHTWHFEACVGEEVEVDVYVTAKLARVGGAMLDGMTIEANVKAEMREEDVGDCYKMGNDAIDREWSHSLGTIGPSEMSGVVSGRQVSDELASYDWFELQVFVQNSSPAGGPPTFTP